MPLAFSEVIASIPTGSMYAGFLDPFNRGDLVRAFADADGLNFPLLSDFWPHGAVTTAYDVLDEVRGCPRRSSYVIGIDGRVTWSVHHAMADGRDLDQHLHELRAAVDATP